MENAAKIRLRIGVAAMIGSLLLWPVMAAVPFLPLTVKGRAVAGGILFVIIEVLFWGGGLLAGKEAARRYRDKLDPRTWFRKRS